ncbi:MAG: carotenoid biosynthesis protein [Candidatus Paceibacterota bacterium]
MPFGSSYFLIFETLGFVAFILIMAREIYQRNFIRIFELVSCAVFGMILEIGNTYLAHTYSYGADFLVNLARVPVAIGLGWAVIVYCVMLLSDQYRVPWALRPFMDALTAVILDLAIDPIAIRLGLWRWTIPLDQEWYGVPFENLVGWILVVLSFSFLMRFLRTLNYKRLYTRILMVLSPFLAYFGLMLGLALFSLIAILPYQINNWTILLQFQYSPDLAILSDPQIVFWKTILFVIIMIELVHIVVWSIVKYRRRFLRHFDLLSFLALAGIHLFFAMALFSSGLYRQMPFLVLISLGALSIHIILHLLPYLINPKTLYFFRSIRNITEREEEKVYELIEDKFR